MRAGNFDLLPPKPASAPPPALLEPRRDPRSKSTDFNAELKKAHDQQSKSGAKQTGSSDRRLIKPGVKSATKPADGARAKSPVAGKSQAASANAASVRPGKNANAHDENGNADSHDDQADKDHSTDAQAADAGAHAGDPSQGGAAKADAHRPADRQPGDSSGQKDSPHHGNPQQSADGDKSERPPKQKTVLDATDGNVAALLNQPVAPPPPDLSGGDGSATAGAIPVSTSWSDNSKLGVTKPVDHSANADSAASPVQDGAASGAQSNGAADAGQRAAAGQAAAVDASSDANFTSSGASASSGSDRALPRAVATEAPGTSFMQLVQSHVGVDAPASSDTASTNAASNTPAAPETRFAEANHAQIVTGIHAQLLPRGGTMHIRLDPPELGALQVTVKIEKGTLTASFQTSNDQATRLLSHTLGQLKNVLETQGIVVGKLAVHQSSQSEQNAGGQNRDGQPQQENAANQEQQRRETLRRMWRRLGVGSDPLDLVA